MGTHEDLGERRVVRTDTTARHALRHNSWRCQAERPICGHAVFRRALSVPERRHPPARDITLDLAFLRWTDPTTRERAPDVSSAGALLGRLLFLGTT